MVFLKLIFQPQTRSGNAIARSLNKKEEIVMQPELTCKELTELITDYLEERLSQINRIRFEQHLSVCSACVAYVDQMRVTIHAIGSRPPLKIPPAMEDSLLQAFRRWKNPDH